MNPTFLPLLVGLAGTLIGGGITWGVTRATIRQLVEQVADLKRKDEAGATRLATLEVHQQHLVDDVKFLRERLHEVSTTLQGMAQQLAVALATRERHDG